MYTHKKRYYAERGKICRNLWEREGVQQSEYKYAGCGIVLSYPVFPCVVTVLWLGVKENSCYFLLALS